jgi:hypothetical protein
MMNQFLRISLKINSLVLILKFIFILTIFMTEGNKTVNVKKKHQLNKSHNKSFYMFLLYTLSYVSSMCDSSQYTALLQIIYDLQHCYLQKGNSRYHFFLLRILLVQMRQNSKVGSLDINKTT